MSQRTLILAGGRGTRLAPYTSVLPKPLMPIGGRSILEIVVEQLREAGFRDLTFAVGYLGHLIEAVFADGSNHGVAIDYHRELHPLGTAGPLAQIERLEEPFLMMNGDVLTSLAYGDLYRAHCEAGNALTIATHLRRDRSDYGILRLDGEETGMRRVVGYDEKPETIITVSMGVYAMDPVVKRYVPRHRPFDVPELVLRLLEAGEPVGSFVHDGLWLDIGRQDDFEKAVVAYEAMQLTESENGMPMNGAPQKVSA